MPYTTVTAGSYATSDWANTNVRDQVVSQFTTSAARDAAITAPAEGMVASLSAPSASEYATTGGLPAPAGTIFTAYNGTRWVPITPLGATTAATGTTVSTTFSTTLTSGGTNPSVTIITGTAVYITLSADLWVSAGAGTAWMSVDVSGATTLAASNGNGLTATYAAAATAATSYSRTFLLLGLTAGANTFTLSYKVSANTLNIGNRSIVVSTVF